ncbi:MAG: hypothetical protein JKY70_18770, partial [Mucilaginibacter sp.]|nr:hypothetical protein [Mucilaginibacter sp.]
MNKVFFALILSFISTAALAQITGGVQRGVRTGGQSVSADSLNYLSPKDYIIGGVTIAGVQHLDKDVILTISKLNK